MSSIINFTCQSKNRNVESLWKFQGQSTLQMRMMLKKLFAQKINIKANNITLKQPTQHFCEENSIVNIIFTLLLCFSYRKLGMGQFESLSSRMNIVYMKTLN